MSVSVNNFSIKIATVNGSGSQTSNQILLKSLFRAGIPVGAKNIFPSNIQGMPTWYYLRASEAGYTGLQLKADITVALNDQTLIDDHQNAQAGSVFIFDSKSKNTFAASRDDLFYISVPFSELAGQASEQVKYKKYLVNSVYVGVVSELLRMPSNLVEETLTEFFLKNENVLRQNRNAFSLGVKFVREKLSDIQLPVKIVPTQKNSNQMLIDGNTAAALGMLYGGATFASWYPITPSTSLMESFEKFCQKYRISDDGKNNFSVIQAEDELSSICMTLGAGWNGARSFTATSGPGLSLMHEAAGYAYYAEIPCVIWNVQRAGPSTGMPTRSAQGDISAAYYSSHGDTHFPLLLPGHPEECFEFAQLALDIAEGLQTLVYVLSDLDIGMNIWRTNQFRFSDQRFNRGKVLTSENLEQMALQGQRYQRYFSAESDGVAARALPGTRHPDAAYLTRGSGHNIKGVYTENGNEYIEVVDRLEKKWQQSVLVLPEPVIQDQGFDVGIVCYGSATEILLETIQLLSEKNIHCDYLRIRSLPFHSKVKEYIQLKKMVYVLDLNQSGQVFDLLKVHYPEYWQRFNSVKHYSGIPMQATELANRIAESENKNKGADNE